MSDDRSKPIIGHVSFGYDRGAFDALVEPERLLRYGQRFASVAAELRAEQNADAGALALARLMAWASCEAWARVYFATAPGALMSDARAAAVCDAVIDGRLVLDWPSRRSS